MRPACMACMYACIKRGGFGLGDAAWPSSRACTGTGRRWPLPTYCGVYAAHVAVSRHAVAAPEDAAAQHGCAVCQRTDPGGSMASCRAAGMQPFASDGLR